MIRQKIKRFIDKQVRAEVNFQLNQKDLLRIKAVLCDTCKKTIFIDNAQIVESISGFGVSSRFYCDEHKKGYDSVNIRTGVAIFIKKNVEVDSTGKIIKTKKK